MGKYIKVFETTADYQQFMGGGEVPLPNVSYIRETNNCNYTPKKKIELTFPVTLVLGDNGEIGRQLYSYLVKKYNSSVTLNLSEVIYCNNTYITTIGAYEQYWGDNSSAYGIGLLYNGSGSADGIVLTKDGFVAEWKSKPGSPELPG